MSGGVILLELFVRVLSRISAMEQMCILVWEVMLGPIIRFISLVTFEFCSHSAFAS